LNQLSAIFGNSFLIALSGALMPGPLLVVTVARTPSNGVRVGPLVTLGHAFIELLTVLILSLGLASIVHRNPVIARMIAIIGGIALFLMGLAMMRELRVARKEHRVSTDTTPKITAARLVGSGILSTISNPYWFLWWATIGSALIIISLQRGILGVVSCLTGHLAADFLWYSTLAVVTWKGRMILSTRNYDRIVSACCIFLLLLSIGFIYRGVVGFPAIARQ
jgi:threonine/homoserine/homoserine lactone efflux protein